VSNLGGCLTPIGDPPLFLGYLKGVSFWWVLAHCWKAWLIGVSGLLAIFYVLDRRNFFRAPAEIREEKTGREEWQFHGLRNVWFLALVLAGIFLPLWWREGVMAGAAVASWFLTPKEVHKANAFDFHPIMEVAWLFAGIFTTMIPALEWLKSNAGLLGIQTPHQFFWVTGTLSGILDNAPTYLAFLAAAFGLKGMDFNDSRDVAAFAGQHADVLAAISVSSVFFGAMTYLGNGPNFMVKAIATAQRAEAPGFLAYIVRYSIPVLLPFLLLLGVLFFSRWRVF
jgi:Na+/H+ antiporter NhaD/arsenite permease-like protein